MKRKLERSSSCELLDRASMFRVSKAWLVLTPRQALRILSLAPTADLTPVAIKKAYIQQTLQCHPDLHPEDPNANDNFRNLSDAFRIALKTLEMQRGSNGARGRTGVREGVGLTEEELYDPQAALESLRQAMVAYRTHQRRNEATSSATGPAPSALSDAQEADTGAFCTPSLEDISSVCQREAVAMRRVYTFCTDLPAVLCGSHSAALFEAVAFFHARYVESMSACVMRFAQNLPILVRRVVKNRRKYVDNKTAAVVQGIGTGARPKGGQRIEDMAMKPLVLMGALIFDLPEVGEGGDAPGQYAETNDDASHMKASSSTCGVSQPSDIQVTDELKCVIYPTDSISDITAKLGKWEAASFQRLKVELAIVDVNRLLSGMLGLQDEEATSQSNSHLSVMPHLSQTFAATETVLRTLQSLASDLCCHFDPALDIAITEEVVDAMHLHETADASSSRRDDDAAESLELPILVAQCRRLAALARPTIRGNTILTWNANETEELVTETEVRAETQPRKDQQRKTVASPKYVVGRHLTCSTAETLFFTVSVVLTKDFRSFLLSLRHALKHVIQATNDSKRVLFELLPLREATLKEEYIALPPSVDDTDSPFRYRGPIHCFPRICNMDAKREHALWKHLHAHREYVALHASTMNPINVFYECFPYDPESPEYRATAADTTAGVLAGWVGGGVDGCDNVIITAQELDDAAHFREWLEEVVAQSSLNREAEEVLAKAGVGYVSRDATLPLANFLSFAKVFVQSLAVRGVLERRDGGTHTSGTVTSDDIGLSIIVSPSRCDVCDGGRLFVPWYVDPSILLALLGEHTPHHQLHA